MQTTYTEAPVAPDQEVAVMSWIDHLRELRNRLVKASLAIFVGMLLGFFAVTRNNYALLTALIEHFTNDGVQIIRPAEVFTETIKLALGVGIAAAMPVIVYQILAFIVPALTDRERRFLYMSLPFVTICFISGLLFGWFVTLPAAFTFLLNIGPDIISKQPTLEQFISLFVRLELINGALFELPVIVYTVIWLGAVQRSTLVRYRRYTILVIVILSAIITPTGDPVNLAFTAVPMYLLYEFGLLLAWIAPRRRTAPAAP